MTTALSRRTNSLNGWERLWILVCVATAFGIAGFLAMSWPTEAEIIEDQSVYAVELALKVSAAKAKTAGNERDELTLLRALEAGPRTARLETYGDLSPEQVLARIEPILMGTPELQLLETRRSKDQATLASTRRYHVGIGLVIWICVAALSYALGWSFAWVRSGFKQTDKA
jgi:hypothetical protein